MIIKAKSELYSIEETEYGHDWRGTNLGFCILCGASLGKWNYITHTTPFPYAHDPDDYYCVSVSLPNCTYKCQMTYKWADWKQLEVK